MLAIVGDLDLASAHELLAAAESSAGAAEPLRLDLSGVTFLDSTGVGALLKIRRAATDAGREVRVTGRSEAVDRVLELAGISELFSPAERDGDAE